MRDNAWPPTQRHGAVLGKKGVVLLRLLADNAILCSMSLAGNVWDTAAMESFFSSLKTEQTARKVLRTCDAARADVFDDIKRFHNPRRRHAKLGYLSPMECEARAVLT